MSKKASNLFIKNANLKNKNQIVINIRIIKTKIKNTLISGVFREIPQGPRGVGFFPRFEMRLGGKKTPPPAPFFADNKETPYF